ncbi:MAG: hypothetical protein EA376_04370 [Phycisphaeraceae bacterium]|nr:MAG: hypothetical protein EA376_04370 [Phycisphaeraceae bacterium]
MKKQHTFAGVGLVGALTLAVAGVTLAQQGRPGGPGQPPQGANPMAALDGLVRGLEATPGCLGDELALTQSGKSVIFAWFTDKKAVVDWYYSPTHQRSMEMMFQNVEQGVPLEHVEDGTGPIMVIASLTMRDPSQMQGGEQSPISQIAIEMYEPLPGGIHLNGRFAPVDVQVPHLTDASGLED